VKARIQEEASIATAAAWKKAEQESILATATTREQESILEATATQKKIELDAKLSTLQLKREAAAAMVQAEVLEAAANLDKEENLSEFGTQIPVKDRDQLTRKNILDWSEQCINAPPPNDTEQRSGGRERGEWGESEGRVGGEWGERRESGERVRGEWREREGR
ncbi:unnamed protein product, partial [Lampetra fluviatilis]